MVTMIVVSYLTKEPDYEAISGLTSARSRTNSGASHAAAGAAIDVIASLAVIAAILAAYLYFTG